MTRFVFFDFDDVHERNGKDRLHSTNIIELQIEFSNCNFFFFERNDNRQTKNVSKNIKKKAKKNGAEFGLLLLALGTEASKRDLLYLLGEPVLRT